MDWNVYISRKYLVLKKFRDKDQNIFYILLNSINRMKIFMLS
jgi:hypothetical protein